MKVSSRKIEITEDPSSSDGLALIIAEIILGGVAPDHLTIAEALAALEDLDADMAERVRRAGRVVHTILVKVVNASVHNAREQDKAETKH